MSDSNVFPCCVRLLIACVVAASSLLLSTVPALAQSGVSPAEFSLLPREDGFELRAHGQVIGYGGDGGFLGLRIDAFTETPLSFYRPSDVWVQALPAQGGFDPVVVVQRRTQACTRVRMEDGRSLLRVASVLPAPPELSFTPPPGQPVPTPLGNLGWANDRRDPAHLAGLAARDSQGLIYAFDWRFLPSTLFSLRTYAPDCSPLAAVERIRAFDAHPARPGVYVVHDRAPAPGLRLSRFEAGQMDWDIDLPAALQVSPGQIAHLWLRALEDGSLLLAGAGSQSERLELAVFDRRGQVLQRGQLPGRSVAALREQGDSLLLAVGDQADRAGARSLVELDRSLQLRHRTELAEGYVLGPLGSSGSGLRGAEWLVHADDRAVNAMERSEPSRWGALRFQPGGLVEWPLSMGELRPRLRLGNGALLVSRSAAGSTQLAMVRTGSAPEWLQTPRVALPESQSRPSQAALDDGRVARLRLHGNVSELVLQRGLHTVWRRTLDQVPLFSINYLHAEGERVCVSAYDNSAREDGYSLFCYRAADGVALPVQRWVGVPWPLDPQRGGWDAEGAASLFLRHATNGGGSEVRHLRAPASGVMPSTAVIPVANERQCASRALASEPAIGAVVLEREGETFYARRYAASGVLLWRHALPLGLRCPGVLAMAADGDVLVGEFSLDGDRTGLQEVLLLSEARSLRWRTDLSALGVRTSVGAVEPARWLDVNDAEQWVGVVTQGGQAALLQLDRATGEVRGLTRPTLGAPHAGGWELAKTARPGEVLLLQREPSRAYARRLHIPNMRLGPPSQMVLPWDTQARSVLRVGESLEAVRFTGDPVEISSWNALSAPPFAADTPLGAEHSGLWYDPQITGQGLMLDVEAPRQRWFAAWFSFRTPTEAGAAAGSASHEGLRWYSMLGQGSPQAGMPLAATLFASANGRFDGGAPQTIVRGETQLRAIDCNTLEFQYRIEPARPGAGIAEIGARRLQRLGPPPASCGGTSLAEQSGLRAASTGSWVLEGRPNQGILMQVDPGAAGQPGALWGAWFGFAPVRQEGAGHPHWLTLGGRSAPAQPGVVEIEWTRTTAGLLDTLPTANSHVIGTGRLRFTACDRAVLEYSFDAPGLAGDAFAGLQGQVNLRRFEPCD
jgi:hypothetical protein